MLKRKLGFTLVLGLLLCFASSAYAWSLSGLKSWYTKSGNTGFELVIRDPNWEVNNKTVTIYFYNNRRQLVKRAYAFLKDGYLANNSTSDAHIAVNIHGDNFKVRGFLEGKISIATVRVTLGFNM